MKPTPPKSRLAPSGRHSLPRALTILAVAAVIAALAGRYISNGLGRPEWLEGLLGMVFGLAFLSMGLARIFHERIRPQSPRMLLMGASAAIALLGIAVLIYGVIQVVGTFSR